MRTQDEIVRRVQNRLRDSWTTVVLTEALDGGTNPAPQHAGASSPVDPPWWPHSFPLGKQSSADIARNFGAHVRLVQAWRDWAAEHQVRLVEEPRSIAGTPQQAATHIVVPDIDTAAAMAGDGWPERLSVGRARANLLHARFPVVMRPDSKDAHQVLRGATRLSDLDFDILCRVVNWFQQTPLAARQGLTPRQV